MLTYALTGYKGSIVHSKCLCPFTHLRIGWPAMMMALETQLQGSARVCLILCTISRASITAANGRSRILRGHSYSTTHNKSFSECRFLRKGSQRHVPAVIRHKCVGYVRRINCSIQPEICDEREPTLNRVSCGLCSWLTPFKAGSKFPSVIVTSKEQPHERQRRQGESHCLFRKDVYAIVRR